MHLLAILVFYKMENRLQLIDGNDTVWVCVGVQWALCIRTLFNVSRCKQ